MISAGTVSIILTIVWLIAFFVTRKKQYTVKWYFFLLFTMSSAGIFLDLDEFVYYVSQSYRLGNILVFAILLLLVLIPWLRYDKWLKNVRFTLNAKYVGVLKIICIVSILLSVFCIIYCLPYAIIANRIGAEGIRLANDGGLLPHSYLTTMATAVATLAPVGVLLFYIGLLDFRLRRYAFGALLVPLAGVVHSMACSARELYIFLPMTFIILYFAFAESLSFKQQKTLKRLGLFGGAFLLFFFLTITISRFGEVGSDSFISGTWGYLYQQPYVFDQTLQFFDNYKGFSKSLKFIGEMIGANITSHDVILKTEWSFGTMYKAFYEMFGYSSLVVGTIIYICFFTLMGKSCLRKKNAFSTLVNFTIFVWLTISGLFYFRYGGNDSQFILYILMMILAPFYPRVLNVVSKKSQCSN